MSLAVIGWSVLSAAGIGREPFSAAVKAGATEVSRPSVAALYPEALPCTHAHALVNLNARELLGRKGTGSLDRRTVLALVACRDALGDADVSPDDSNRHRIGVTFGTTWGSFQAMSDYTKETYIEERPYLVEPARFPNTVMNCAAGQAAIWFGLRGVNATVAGGTMSFLNSLDYATNLMRCGYADLILAGAVEEFTPHTAWATHLMRRTGMSASPGEAAGVFVLQRARDARAEGRTVLGEVVTVTTGFSPGGAAGPGATDALARCIRQALARAEIQPSDISLIAAVETGDHAGTVEREATRRVFNGSQPERIVPTELFGDCHAAVGALQLGALIVLQSPDRTAASRYSLMTACTDDGAVGAAVVKV